MSFLVSVELVDGLGGENVDKDVAVAVDGFCGECGEEDIALAVDKVAASEIENDVDECVFGALDLDKCKVVTKFDN